jgi:hypothetical protein
MSYNANIFSFTFSSACRLFKQVLQRVISDLLAAGKFALRNFQCTYAVYLNLLGNMIRYHV